MSQILVLGSINMDLVVRGQKLPLPGETVVGGEFRQSLGGKGANQAVAAARLAEKEVLLIGAIGEDAFGAEARQQFQREQLQLEQLRVLSATPTGVAIIMVDEHGENCISVASGANADVTRQSVKEIPQTVFDSASIALTSFEMPLDAVACFLQRAKNAGLQTILNPAPVPRDHAVVNKLLPHVDVLTPNEIELAGLSDGEPPELAVMMEKLMEMGVGHVVVTRGAEGCLVWTDDGPLEIPATRVTAIDTTAAGDAFNGALAVRLAEGDDLATAAAWANRVAAISVTRHGAQTSLPTAAELADDSASG